jgi:hypothetical protein
MNKNSVEKLIENMGKDIDEKISVEIKKNNEKIRNITFLVAQILVTVFVIYLEIKR